MQSVQILKKQQVIENSSTENDNLNNLSRFRNSRIRFPPIGSSTDLGQKQQDTLRIKNHYRYNEGKYEIINKSPPYQQKKRANYLGTQDQPVYTQNISLEYQIAKAQRLKEFHFKTTESPLQSEQERQNLASKVTSRLKKAELSLPNLQHLVVSQTNKQEEANNYIKLIPDDPLKSRKENLQVFNFEDKNKSFYSISTVRKISQPPQQNASQQSLKVQEKLSESLLKNSHIIMPGRLQDSPYVKSFTAKQQLNQVQLDQIKKRKLQHLNDAIKIQKEEQQLEVQKKIQEETDKKKTKKFFGLF